nr:WD-40 repeat-containing protein MSI4-like [Tanacetum cinerariifolium]
MISRGIDSLESSNKNMGFAKKNAAGCDYPVYLGFGPIKSSVFRSSAEDGRVNIWDHKQVGRTTEHGPSTPAGLFFKHCGHRAQVTDFHWNDHAPWTIVSVSASYDAELDNAESHDAESDYTESDDDDDDDDESGYTESDDDDAEPDDPESDDDQTTSGGGTLQIWQMHGLTYKAVLDNSS